MLSIGLKGRWKKWYALCNQMDGITIDEIRKSCAAGYLVWVEVTK